MNGKEYLVTQITMIELGKKIETLDLDSFLKCIANAEATAPILDPTLYRRAAANLEAVKALAQSFQKVKTEFAKVREAVINTTVAYMVNDAEQEEKDPHEKLAE